MTIPNDDIGRVSASIAAQLQLLAKRLEAAGVDLGADDDEIEVGMVADFVTGEQVTAIAVDGITYHDSGGLVRQRERAGEDGWASASRERIEKLEAEQHDVLKRIADHGATALLSRPGRAAASTATRSMPPSARGPTSRWRGGSSRPTRTRRASRRR